MKVKQRLASLAYLSFALGLLGLCLRPVFASPQQDAYPFSTYPMFAAKRKNPQFSVAQMQSAAGDWSSVPPKYLGTDEVMQAAVTIRKASRSRKRARVLCRQISKKIAENQTTILFKKTRIMRLTFDPLTYFSEGAKPLKEKQVVSCRVPELPKK